MNPTVAVIVVAAGSGTRLGLGQPKAFVSLGGRSILSRSLDALFALDDEAQVIVVVPEDRLDEALSTAQDVAGAAAPYVTVVAGGESRQQSVNAGLAVLLPSVQTVLVHDAARALTPVAQFEAVIDAVRQSGYGAIPGLPVSDTIKRTDGFGLAVATVDRSELAAVQTPQGFPRAQLEQAYAAASDDFTDDAALVAEAGFAVAVIHGDALAFKITTAWDLRRAEQVIESAFVAAAARPVPPRTGVGIDAHAFADEGEEATHPLWLAGLEWPGERPLAGHSDGDAVAHAICDALLSASGLGDLGSVFGTADPRFEGAHGDVFLAHTVGLVEAAGWRVGNVSVQIVGNRPRFGARRPEAEALLTGLLAAPVTVSATTTDGLGFTGRTEGVVVIATALIYPF
ncbi:MULTISPECIES: 2-C-methyl-D-erythritol 4-phosphate cytidylyltransferase [Subtercola]|uniref:Bifunctional enzyme IspD/IspF n=1 Tax=Subtercola vilae TaxID=2056433 RepID=A0A4T2BHT4_9MICO|nr:MULTISPECIES: 2-C-methyl-D-erythritol 4-phosphate cytidylyltransferase [Subtercola]MEA9985825.1 2-C-methyl-D-erythritol 4-phosphate cytidylyltransferase [Subtercola sp. RTI3]TIH30827.1 2-C-methyl-D-erythritol 2,4-cyclodiphosphate synthase [Subtercola vilae]